MISSTRPWLTFGSSPRVRGTGSAGWSYARVHRFIPACAGNGNQLICIINVFPVHPRVCGERLPAMNFAPSEHGSSPRVRGTAGPLEQTRGPGRFIPACAGNGAHVRRPLRPWSVHPRVCGERWSSCDQKPTPVGSSPRVRGTVQHVLVLVVLRRFIPACAGNGCAGRRGSAANSVHPRVCGERHASSPYHQATGGSSPRVRGTELRPPA